MPEVYASGFSTEVLIINFSFQGDSLLMSILWQRHTIDILEDFGRICSVSAQG
jgi:hypothetical protein